MLSFIRFYLFMTFLLFYSVAVNANSQTTPISLFVSETVKLQSMRSTRNINSTRVVFREALLSHLELERLILALKSESKSLPAITLPSIDHLNSSPDEYKLRLHKKVHEGEWMLVGQQVDVSNSSLLMTVSESDGLSLTARDKSGSMTALGKDNYLYAIKSVLGVPGSHHPGETQQRVAVGNEVIPLDAIDFSNQQAQISSMNSTNSNSVDLLVVTTDAATAFAGGSALLKQSIEAAVSDTNISFDNSGVGLQINLVKVESTNYTETNNIVTDHTRLQVLNDGFLDEVHDLRDQYSADLVMLVVGEGDNFCGYAGWGYNGQSLLPQFGFSVLAEYCISTTVFAHELGHNFGLQHDRFINNSGGYLPYGHGYTAPSESWFTIMAYPDGCNFNCFPLNRWSNPVQQFAGEALGIPIGNPNAADNVSALEFVKADVLSFRVPPNDPPTEINLHTSCLAGSGRVDLNIINTESDSSVYRLEFQGLSARELTISANAWARFRLTGRPPGSYSVVVKRDNDVILATSLEVDCTEPVPVVSSPEITPLSTCSAGNGLVLFQAINPTNNTRSYIVEFEGVANRSTSAPAFGQSIRGVSGRPDGTYSYTVRTGATLLKSGQVTVQCD